MLKNCQSWKSKIIKNLNWPNWRKMSNIVKSDQIDENCQKLSISCSGQLQDQWTAKKCQKYSKIVNNNNKNVNICWIWSISESSKLVQIIENCQFCQQQKKLSVSPTKCHKVTGVLDQKRLCEWVCDQSERQGHLLTCLWTAKRGPNERDHQMSRGFVKGMTNSCPTVLDENGLN